MAVINACSLGFQVGTIWSQCFIWVPPGQCSTFVVHNNVYTAPTDDVSDKHGQNISTITTYVRATF